MTNFSDQKGSKTTILQSLRIHGPTSRIALTKLTGLSRATISVAITELIEAKLVRESETMQSSGGRPAVVLDLVPGSHAILGADLDGDVWRIGAFDLLGNMLKANVVSNESLSAEASVNLLTDELKRFIQNLEQKPVPIVGLGTPGLVDTHRGIIQSAADLSWHNVEIGKMVADRLGWPAVVVNRHRARGLAECRYGAGNAYKNMVYIGVGSGIAAGLFIDRQLIPGALGGAGEVGHMTIEPNGPFCPCGNNGCLQLFSSSPAIELEARKLLRTGDSSLLYPDNGFDLQLLKVDHICAAADRGDPLAMKVINTAASYLGIAMANLVNLFNPEAIILGGPVMKACNTYVQFAEKIMQQRAMSPLAAATVVKTSHFKETGGALGAANFALDKHMTLSLLSE